MLEIGEMKGARAKPTAHPILRHRPSTSEGPTEAAEFPYTAPLAGLI